MTAVSNTWANTTAISFTVSGLSGAGYVALITQASAPSTPSGSIRIYDNASDQLSWIQPSGFVSTIDTSALSANRTWSFPNAAGNIVIDSASQVLTNKTITSTTNNVAADSLKSATGVVSVVGATAPSTGQALVATGATTATWQSVATSISGWTISNSLSTGLNDDSTVTAGAWSTRALNTLANTTGATGVALATNQITISVAGTYLIDATVPGYNVSMHKARLFNITDVTTALTGTSELASGTLTSRSIIKGFLIVSTTKVYELQWWYDVNDTETYAPGLAVGASGANEIFAVINILKIA